MSNRKAISVFMILMGIIEIALFWGKFCVMRNSYISYDFSLKQMLSTGNSIRVLGSYAYAMMLILPSIFIIFVSYDMYREYKSRMVALLPGAINVIDLMMSVFIAISVSIGVNGNPNLHYGYGLYGRVIIDIFMAIVSLVLLCSWKPSDSTVDYSVEEELLEKEVIYEDISETTPESSDSDDSEDDYEIVETRILDERPRKVVEPPKVKISTRVKKDDTEMKKWFKEPGDL